MLFFLSPSLKLQDFTAADMRKYIDGQLKKNPRGRQLAVEEAESYRDLIYKICRKADGIFLWVRLIINGLSRDLSNRDTVGLLIDRVDELPADLNKLFCSMIGALDYRHRCEAARFFRILFAAPQKPEASLSLLDMFFAETATVITALAYSASQNDLKHLESR